MSQHEKQAWFNLVVVAIATGAVLALVPLLGAQRAFGALGILSLSSVRFFFITKKEASEIITDERDRAIQSKSSMIAYSVFWVVFVGSVMGLWAAYYPRGAVPVALLPLFPALGYMVVLFVQAAATLVQYRHGREDALG